MIRVEAVRGPAYMASALINGDVSSFDDEGRDQAELDRFLEWVAPGRIVSTVDASEHFTTIIYAGGAVFTGDVVDYVVLYNE